MSKLEIERSAEKMEREKRTLQEKLEDKKLVENIFPEDDTDASKRFQLFSAMDPYPDIKPALLNSADILKYIITTGMLYPFDIKQLEGASYEVKLAGKVVYWTDKGKKVVKKIVENPDSENPEEAREFVLEKNSIAFVTLEPMFRIPDYLALRFNLKISHIYKGLLLGTGPLVDPGFVGKLSIPLHNLTGNSYKFEYGKGMIQLEFTKLSNAKEFDASEALLKSRYVLTQPGIYIHNDIPPQRDVENYIEKAVSGAIVDGRGDSIVKSAIPETIQQITENSEQLKTQINTESQQAEQKRQEFEAYIKDEIIKAKQEHVEFKDNITNQNEKANNLNKISIFAIAAMIITIITLSFNTLKTLEDANYRNAQEVSALTNEYMKLSDQYKDLEDRYTSLENRYNDLINQDQKAP